MLSPMLLCCTKRLKHLTRAAWNHDDVLKYEWQSFDNDGGWNEDFESEIIFGFNDRRSMLSLSLDLLRSVTSWWRHFFSSSSHPLTHLCPEHYTRRRELSKRRTKTLVNTCQPQWNQSFVYPGIRPTDLRSRVLEVTVWDYDRFGANEFLGEVCLDLGSMLTTGEDVEPVWHTLQIYENGSGMVRACLGFVNLSPPNANSMVKLYGHLIEMN